MQRSSAEKEFSKNGIVLKFGALRRKARIFEYERRALWLITLLVASARLKKKGQWSSVQSQVSGAPESPRSVGIERPHDLVVGLERSYKWLEEIWESH